MGTCFLIPPVLLFQTEFLQPQLRDSTLPFEGRLLKECMANMRHLKHLKMRQVCTDEILHQVIGGVKEIVD